MSAAQDTIPRLVKRPPRESFDLARSLYLMANGYKIIAVELEKMAAAGITIEQLKEAGIVKTI